MVREAFHQLHQALERQQLHHSAEVYAEISAEDDDLHPFTDTAIEGWPE